MWGTFQKILQEALYVPKQEKQLTACLPGETETTHPQISHTGSINCIPGRTNRTKLRRHPPELKQYRQSHCRNKQAEYERRIWPHRTEGKGEVNLNVWVNQGLRDQIGEWKSSQAKQNEVYCVGNMKQLRFFKQGRNMITVFMKITVSAILHLN